MIRRPQAAYDPRSTQIHFFAPSRLSLQHVQSRHTRATMEGVCTRKRRWASTRAPRQLLLTRGLHLRWQRLKSQPRAHLFRRRNNVFIVASHLPIAINLTSCRYPYCAGPSIGELRIQALFTDGSRAAFHPEDANGA